MPTRLIINADDLGLTRGVNRAVAELHQAGCLTSATLMANGAAFADAVSVARSNPRLGIGCHVVLTDGIPLSSPASIPSLLDPASSTGTPRLRSSLTTFARASLLGRLYPEEVEREITAQVTRLLEAGIRPTHLDTHKHTHLFPAVLVPLLRVAERLGIPAIRNPFEQRWSLDLGAGTLLRRLQIHGLNRLQPSFIRHLAQTRVATTDGTIGVSATGDLTPDTLAALLDALPDGTWELVCHPGSNDADLDRITTRLRHHREVERDALLSIVPDRLATSPDLQLISFAALAVPTQELTPR